MGRHLGCSSLTALAANVREDPLTIVQFTEIIHCEVDQQAIDIKNLHSHSPNSRKFQSKPPLVFLT
jgi:hypothetical protein